MADELVKPTDAVTREPGVTLASKVFSPISPLVPPKAPCLTCATQPSVTAPKTEPARPPTSPLPVAPSGPMTNAPTLPTSGVLDQELGKVRQVLLKSVAPPSAPVAAPFIQPQPRTVPRPIITPALSLAAPRELLWSQLGVGYVGMQPFTLPMVNGGLSGTMTGSTSRAALRPRSLAARVASIEAQAGIAQVLEYISTLLSGGTLARSGTLQDVAARLSAARDSLIVDQCSPALASVDRALRVLKSTVATRSIPSSIRNSLVSAITDGVRPPIVLCEDEGKKEGEGGDGDAEELKREKKAAEKQVNDALDEAEKEVNNPDENTDKSKQDKDDLNAGLEGVRDMAEEVIDRAKSVDELKDIVEGVTNAVRGVAKHFCFLWVHVYRVEAYVGTRPDFPGSNWVIINTFFVWASSHTPVLITCSVEATLQHPDGTTRGPVTTGAAENSGIGKWGTDPAVLNPYTSIANLGAFIKVEEPDEPIPSAATITAKVVGVNPCARDEDSLTREIDSLVR